MSETFLSLKRNEKDMIKKYIDFHEKCPSFLSDFNETWIISPDVRKILKYQISWKSVQWKGVPCEWMDRLTTMAKLVVAFRNFSNAL